MHSPPDILFFTQYIIYIFKTTLRLKSAQKLREHPASVLQHSFAINRFMDARRLLIVTFAVKQHQANRRRKLWLFNMLSDAAIPRWLADTGSEA